MKRKVLFFFPFELLLSYHFKRFDFHGSLVSGLRSSPRKTSGEERGLISQTAVGKSSLPFQSIRPDVTRNLPNRMLANVFFN